MVSLKVSKSLLKVSKSLDPFVDVGSREGFRLPLGEGLLGQVAVGSIPACTNGVNVDPGFFCGKGPVARVCLQRYLLGVWNGCTTTSVEGTTGCPNEPGSVDALTGGGENRIIVGAALCSGTETFSPCAEKPIPFGGFECIIGVPYTNACNGSVDYHGKVICEIMNPIFRLLTVV